MKNILKTAIVPVAFQLAATKLAAQTVASKKVVNSKKENNGSGDPKSNKVLLVGIDPKKLDFTKIPNLTEQELSKALETQKQRLIAAGYDAEWCLIDLGETAEKIVKDKLCTNEYSLVLVGAGIRTLPDNFMLFEDLINVIHKYASNAQIGFNRDQNDTEISVKRRLKL